jgi:hypothetical protein
MEYRSVGTAILTATIVRLVMGGRKPQQRPVQQVPLPPARPPALRLVWSSSWADRGRQSDGKR